MSFSTQPNEMLDMILNQTGIPLPQRIRLRAVSHRFRAILEDGLQQENSLVIRVVNRSDMKELKSGHSKVQPNELILSVSNFTKKKAIALIARLFPRLTELSINSNSNIAWRKATELLGHFAGTLTNLKVDGHLKNVPTRESVFRSLGKCINSIVPLSSLYLEHEMVFEYIYEPSLLVYYPSFGHHLLPHLATTLPRLEHFTFAKPILQNEATFIAASLSSRCTHLHLELASNHVDIFPFDDASNLTYLHLSYANDTILQFIRQLPQLTTLILYDCQRPDLATLLKKLSPLSQVTQVTFMGIDCERQLEPPALKAFTVPSIKQLTLQLRPVYGYSFNPIDYLSTLALWFPNLTTCALQCSFAYHEKIRSIEEGLPYTVKLLDNLETTF